MRRVCVIRTGTANLASVCAAMQRAGLAPYISDDASDIANSELCVLPGVGAFGAAMEKLRRHALDQAIVDRIDRQMPLLAICLGLQLLLDASDESPGCPGLGIATGTATRFTSELRVPQIGWNKVTPTPGFDAAPSGWAYFANSYRLRTPPPGWSAAIADYGGDFVAAMQCSPAIVACQFHPELSGAWGAALIDRWAAVAARQRQEANT